MDEKKVTPKKMTPLRALLGFLVPMVLMITLIFSGVNMAIATLVSVFAACAFGGIMNYKWEELDKAMADGIGSIASACVIMLLVGAMIGIWMASGSVPSMLYYGLKIINPALFLPLAFVLSGFTATATGTSWGAVGTIGIVLIGMSGGLGIPLPITAGAIISGAQMGDKISPLSDTTLLAAASAEVSVFKHIVSMFYTTIPAFVICIVLYSVIGFQYSGTLDYAQVNILLEGLDAGFTINIFMMIPVILVLTLSILQVPAFITFGVGIVAGAVWAIMFQGASLTDVFGFAMSGFVSETGVASIDSLLTRGGITSMLELTSVGLLAGALSGLFTKMDVLHVLVGEVTKRVKSVGGILTATLASSAILATTGSQAPPLTLPAVAFKKVYDEMDIHRCVLSRTMEDVGTLLCAILPYGVATAFYSSTLGVDPLKYIPFTFLPLMSPFISLINAWLGIGVFRRNDPVRYRLFWRRSKTADNN